MKYSHKTSTLLTIFSTISQTQQHSDNGDKTNVLVYFIAALVLSAIE